MEALLFLLGVVIFVIGMLVSIGLHEVGHLVPAKRFGVKVTQYFVGFGNTVWSRRFGETEYGVKALPLGGYVKLVGMLPPHADDAPGTVRGSSTGLFTQLISDARAAEREHIRPGDQDRLFYRLTWWKKLIVMAGGPSVNILIAFLLFWGLFAIHGKEHVELEPVVDNISACIIPALEQRTECTADDPLAPAYAAGIRDGDRLDTFNGTAVASWEQLSGLIRANADGRAVIEVTRDGEPMTFTTHTVIAQRPVSAEDRDLVPVGFLGVSPTQHFSVVKGGPVFTLREMGTMTKQTVEALVQMPVKVWHVALAIAGAEERDPYGPVSIVGGGRFAGETVAHEEISVGDKAVFLVSLIAGFNFFVGMFNFVPLLPLDGGHIAGALYEGLKKGWARLRGAADPGHVDVAKALPIAYAGAGVILVLSLVLIVGDLVVPLRLYT